MVSRQLALLRHAKSSWGDPDLDDHARPLTARGRRAATQMGQHLRQAGVEPDLVLCSSATRTCQTLELLALQGSAEVLIEDELYGATAIELLDRLRQVSGYVASVLVIGHNPGIEELTLMLVGHGSGLGEKFPTAALAEVQLLIERWPELGPGTGRLESFVVPRELE